MKKALRIMFAGGCHVLGYPVGAEYGFPEVVLQSLSEEYLCESRAFGYLSFARSARLLDAYREFSPDVLVLQLGHYECPRPLEKILQKSRLGMLLRSPSAANSPSGSSSRSSACEHAPDPSMSFRSSWRWMLRSATRLVAGIAFEFSGQPVYKRKKIASDLSALLLAIHAHGDCTTILLSPFLCPDYLIRLYRRRSRTIFSDAARKHDCVFVDAQSLLLELETSRRDLSLYADADHLSVKGHEMVGLQLVDKIRESLAQAPKEVKAQDASLSLP